MRKSSIVVVSSTRALILIVMSLVCGSVQAQPAAGAAADSGAYVGVVGGGGSVGATDIAQSGTAFRAPGPFQVNATGRSESDGGSLFGVQAGYEWSHWVAGSDATKWGVRPSVEVELAFVRNTVRGVLVNPQEVIPNHTFEDTLPMRTTVFLVNSMWTLKIPAPARLRAYVGGGAGAARVSVTGADSAQINPAEPGVNHFNSDPDSRDTTLAVQGKGGVVVSLSSRLAVTAEYRYLRLAATDYGFGSTVYPTHVPTSPWASSVGPLGHHTGVIGVRYGF